jgi:predicted DNA binding CopG/RHH family protein
MNARRFHDDDEKQLLAAYERGEFKPVKDQKGAKQIAVEAARRYLRKDARINIRLSIADLDMLKRRAAEEGLPYQSLIASVLHKYVSGSAAPDKKGRPQRRSAIVR